MHATPWEGIGWSVRKGMTGKKMAAVAGLDWGMAVAALRFRVQQNGKEKVTTIKEMSLHRTDTLQHLSIVGPRYVPFQNADVLELFRQYMGVGDMSISTVGSFHDGQIIWALAPMGQIIDLRGDPQEGYALITVPQEASRAAQIAFLNVSTSTGGTFLRIGDSVRIWQTRAFSASVADDANRQLAVAARERTIFARQAHVLAKTPMTSKDVEKMAAKHLRPRPTGAVVALFERAGLESRKGTAWGALNAVIEYTDHHYGTRQEIRLQRSMMDSGDVVKRRVFMDLLRKRSVTEALQEGTS